MKKIFLILLVLLALIAQVFLVKEQYVYLGFFNCIFTQSIITYLAFCLLTQSEKLKNLAKLAEEEVETKKEGLFEKIIIFTLLFVIFLLISLIPFLTTHTTWYYHNLNDIETIHEFKNPFIFVNGFPFIKFLTVKDASYGGITIGILLFLISTIVRHFKKTFEIKSVKRNFA